MLKEFEFSFSKKEKEYPNPIEEANIRELQARMAVCEIVFGNHVIVFNDIFAKEEKSRAVKRWRIKHTLICR